MNAAITRAAEFTGMERIGVVDSTVSRRVCIPFAGISEAICDTEFFIVAPAVGSRLEVLCSNDCSLAGTTHFRRDEIIIVIQSAHSFVAFVPGAAIAIGISCIARIV